MVLDELPSGAAVSHAAAREPGDSVAQAVRETMIPAVRAAATNLRTKGSLLLSEGIILPILEGRDDRGDC